MSNCEVSNYTMPSVSDESNTTHLPMVLSLGWKCQCEIQRWLVFLVNVVTLFSLEAWKHQLSAVSSSSPENGGPEVPFPAKRSLSFSGKCLISSLEQKMNWSLEYTALEDTKGPINGSWSCQKDARASSALLPCQRWSHVTLKKIAVSVNDCLSIRFKSLSS